MTEKPNRQNHATKNTEPCSLPFYAKDSSQRFMLIDLGNERDVSGFPVCFPKERSGYSHRAQVLLEPGGAFGCKLLKHFSELFSSLYLKISLVANMKGL